MHCGQPENWELICSGPVNTSERSSKYRVFSPLLALITRKGIQLRGELGKRYGHRFPENVSVELVVVMGQKISRPRG